MIAYVPGRRRTARYSVKKWSLLAVGVVAAATMVSLAAVFVYNARPERPVIVVIPTAVPTLTAVPYLADGPDPSAPAMYDAPLEVSLGPRTAEAVTLFLGPSEDYIALGTLQAGAAIEVVGRDEGGDWLAVVFPPKSTFRAWLPASKTLEVQDVADLPVEAVEFLP